MVGRGTREAAYEDATLAMVGMVRRISWPCRGGCVNCLRREGILRDPLDAAAGTSQATWTASSHRLQVGYGIRTQAGQGPTAVAGGS